MTSTQAPAYNGTGSVKATFAPVDELLFTQQLMKLVEPPTNYSDAPNITYHYFHPGAKRDSLKIVVPITIIYSLIFISGVIGNIGTCIVIKRNRSMHTATNYYLFSLAISDFLLLISGVPQEMYYIWSKYPYVFGEYFCIARGLLAETSANATVLTITAFTVERYVAICHPFLGQAMSKLSRAIRIIVLIWVFAVLSAIPQVAQFGIDTSAGYERCQVVRIIFEHSFQLATFVFFFAPMSIILVLYLLIGLRLHRSNMIGGAEPVSGGSRASMQQCGSRKVSRLSMRGNQSDTVLYRYSIGMAAAAGGGSGAGSISGCSTQLSAVRGRINQSGTRRVIKMLVAVVICFFLCWAPFHAQRLVAVWNHTDPGNEHHEFIYHVMTYISGVLYYMSTCINPLLYNIMSNKFREAFKAILFRKKSKNSLNSRRIQESHRLRRNPTLTSSTQRESSDSEMQSKPCLSQVALHERKPTKPSLI